MIISSSFHHHLIVISSLSHHHLIIIASSFHHHLIIISSSSHHHFIFSSSCDQSFCVEIVTFQHEVTIVNFWPVWAMWPLRTRTFDISCLFFPALVLQHLMLVKMTLSFSFDLASPTPLQDFLFWTASCTHQDKKQRGINSRNVKNHHCKRPRSSFL